MKRLIAISLAFLTLTACSLAPAYKTPETDVPGAFKEDLGQWKEGNPQASAQDRGNWWSVFNDETLNKLQAEALSGNQDIAAMLMRVRQARKTADIAGSFFFPTIDGNTSATRQKPNAAARGMGAGDIKIENNYQVGLGISYELDLFGRVLDGKRAAKADADAVGADYQSALLALHSDPAGQRTGRRPRRHRAPARGQPQYPQEAP